MIFSSTKNLAVFGLFGCVLPLSAQPDARQQLVDRQYPSGYHTVLVHVTVDPEGEVAPHTHPGIEIGYVVRGKAELRVVNSPPRVLFTGDSFTIAPNTIHSLRNLESTSLTLVSTYVLELGKPLLTPAPPGAQP